MRSAAHSIRSSGRMPRFALVVSLLPALMARALIPIGYMPVVSELGALTLQLCPGTVAASRDRADGKEVHHHHHGEGAGQSPDRGSHELPCPFAATASAAPTPTFEALPDPAIEQAPLAFRHPAPAHTPSIVRSQSPRGPPARN